METAKDNQMKTHSTHRVVTMQDTRFAEDVSWYIQPHTLFIKNQISRIMLTKYFDAESFEDDAPVSTRIGLAWPGIGPHGADPIASSEQPTYSAQPRTSRYFREALWYMQPNDIIRNSITGAFLKVASKKFTTLDRENMTVEVAFESVPGA